MNMKIKIFVSIFALLALAVFTGATVWEGAAAVAVGGDLPDSGYYAATNSFPRNTVVDITNLENGKSIRVIVASGLETPGLLAIVSRNAADEIGLPGRSIGRIRISQPADPVAFSRFTEGLTSSGDPDYDPSGMSPDESVYAPPPPPETPAGRSSFAYVPESEWADDSYSEVIDLPENYSPAAIVEDEGVVRAGVPFVVASAGDEADPFEAEENPESEIAAENAGEENAVAETFEEAVPLAPPEDAIAIEEEPAAEPVVEIVDEPEAEAEEPAGEIVEEPEAAEHYDYTLLPAEERPPAESDAAAEPVMDESAFVEPIEAAVEMPSPPQPEVAAPEGPFVDPITPAAVTEVVVVPPENIVEPPSQPEVAAPVESIFSVPVISALEQGKYYVQLGAFNRAEVVEDELVRIGKSYPLTIQSGGTDEKPLYRILLGPLNLGESGAILQRFKSIGYRDAFLRRN